MSGNLPAKQTTKKPETVVASGFQTFFTSGEIALFSTPRISRVPRVPRIAIWFFPPTTSAPAGLPAEWFSGYQSTLAGREFSVSAFRP